MAQLKRFQQTDFQQLNQTGPKTSLIKKGSITYVCKQVGLQKKTWKDLVDEIDSIKLKLQSPAIYFPEGFWEEKTNIYFVYKKFKFSMGDLIQLHRRQGVFIPMQKLSNYVSDYTNWVSKLHKHKIQHCRIKPSNLFEDEEGECIITDLHQFSNDNSEQYLPPESIIALKKNQSQRFSQGVTLNESLGGDAFKVDVWQLGITFLQMASLKDINELLVFREQNASESPKAIEIKELCRKVYGGNFIRMIEKMLIKNPNQRSLIDELDDIIQDFLADQIIIADENLLKPNPELLLQEVSEKIEIMKKQSVQQFFAKYQLQPVSCKIKSLNFWDALEDLGIKVNMKEKAALVSLYDLQQTEELDLSTWIKKQQKKIKLGELSLEEHKVLNEMFNDINKFLIDKQINLLELFRQQDPEQNDYLPYDKFHEILAKDILELEGDDEVIVKKKFDPEKKGIIYYQLFVEEITSTNQQELGMNDLKKKIYRNIRERNNTFLLFFKEWDKSSKGYLAYDDLYKFLNEISVHPSQDIMKDLLNKFDPGNKKQIYFEDFRGFFVEFINEDLKDILQAIADGLVSIQMTLPQLIRSSTKSSQLIAQSKLFDALKQTYDAFKRADFMFLMNIIGAKEDVEYPQFVQAIALRGKDLAVKNWQQFQEANLKEQQQQVKKSAFDDPDEALQKSINFNPKLFDSQKILLQHIYKCVQERELTPRQYFKCTFQRMSVQQYKERIRGLQILTRDYEIEQEELINNLLLPGDQTQVDIDLLIEAIMYFKDKKIEVYQFNRYNAVIYIELLNKQLKKKNKQIADIEDLDSLGDGVLRKKTLKNFLLRELQLDVEEARFKDFLYYIQQDIENISLQKLRQALKVDDASNKLLDEINTELTYESSKPEQIFRKYDANRNTKLELKEFKEFLQQMAGKVEEKIAETLFFKMDANGDGTINLYEFKLKITKKDVDVSEQQQTKYKYKNTATPVQKQLTPQIMKAVFRLKDAMQENNETLQAFDKKRRGEILINVFQDKVVQYGFDFVDFKQLVVYLQSPENPKFLQYEKLELLIGDCEEAEQLLVSLNQTISSGKIATAQMFYNFDQNGNDTLEKQEFYKLIREIDPMARNKPVDNLFLLLDANSDGSISMSEFKAKVCAKEKPRVMMTGKQQQLGVFDDLMKFLKQSTVIQSDFESRDDNFSNKLDLDTFIMILKKNNGPKITPQELKALAEQLGASQGNNVNYKIICTKAKQYQVETAQTKIDAVLAKLKDLLLQRQSSLIDIAREYDTSNKGKAKLKAIKLGMQDKSINLTDQEWDLLLTIIDQDAQDYIDYYAFHDLINLGLVKFKDSRKVIVVNTNQEIDKIVNSLVQLMEKQISTLLNLFRQVDKDSDNFIDFDEFIRLLLELIGYSTNQEIQRQLFSIFDMDKDGKINFLEFEYQVYKRTEINAQQLDEMKTVLLNGRNVQQDQQLSDLFRMIARGGQFIDFPSLVSYVNAIKRYKIIELDQLFRYFDKEYHERIDEFIFISSLKVVNRRQSQLQQQPPPPLIPQQSNLQLGQQQIQQHQFNQQNQQQNNFQNFQPNNQFPQQIQQPQQPDNFQQFNQYDQPQQFMQNNNNNNQQQFNNFNNQQQFNYNQQGGQLQNQLQQMQFQPNPQFNVGNPMLPSNNQQFPQNNQYQQRQNNFDENQSWQQPSFANQSQSWNQGFGSEVMDPRQNQNQVGRRPSQQNQQQQQQQTMIPRDFDLQFYDQEINKKCIQKNVDYFDLLCQLDETQLPELKIRNPEKLEQIFLFLDILAPTPHVQQYYYYYSAGSDSMSIVMAYLKMNNPGKLLAKALNFTMIKHKTYTRQQLWTSIGQQQQTWGPQQLLVINQNLRIGLNEMEMREAFKYWDNKQLGYITYKMYEDILNQNEIIITVLKKGAGPPTQEMGLQSTLDQFLLHLSEVVLSKDCFNLFEQADKKGYNQIPYNDFLKISRNLLGQLSQDEMKSIKQLLQLNGFINLSDLAKAIKVDRNKNAQYSQDKEKDQFGVAGKAGRKELIGAANKEKFNKILPILNEFLKKRSKTYEDLSLYFFPANSQSTLDKSQFTKKALDAQFGLSPIQCEELYDYLDANGSGHISINEFRLVFQTKSSDAQNKKQAENIIMSQDIEQEILELFNQIDENKNQSLDQRELLKALQSVGLNPGTEELAQYFQQFDRDRSGTISYNEFSHIVKDILKKELLQADDLLEDLRREFRQVCNPTTRMLSKEQVSQVFQNMGVQIKNEELDDLFVEIDEDKSGSIDIDEFIYFIQKNQSGMSAKASAAVMNIKGSRRISLHDLKQIFLTLPNNFIMSFVRGQNKKLQNLPSSYLKPILDSCGFFYQGLNYVEAANFNIKQSILDKVNIKNNYLAEIRLIEATGIPIPDEKDVPRSSFLRREIGIILLDKALNKFEGNCVYVPAAWSQEYEDRWIFDSSAMEQAILLRWGNFDEKIDNMVEIVFEFITYSVNKGRLIQISCAYGSMPIFQLKPGKQIIELKGGAPLKDITIDKKDIRTNRNGWRSLVKALSANIKSQLVLDVVKLTPSQKTKISALPNKCLLNKWALGMQSAFREYFAYRTQMKGEIELNLASDIRIKAWLNCFDCPDVTRPIGQFWNEFVETKASTDHQFLLKAISKMADSLYLMFKNTDFKFSLGDPTARIDHDMVLQKKRAELISDAIVDMKINLGIQTANQSKKPIMITSLEPLNIEEMMDLDNEQDLQAIEKFLNKKKPKKQQQQQQQEQQQQ